MQGNETVEKIVRRKPSVSYEKRKRKKRRRNPTDRRNPTV